MAESPERRIVRRRPPGAVDADAFAGVPPLLARLYAARGVTDAGGMAHGLEQLLPPATLAGMAAASTRLADAVTAGEPIVIVGDYDADGATSCALAVLALREFGAGRVEFAVPNRFEYGYGLSAELVDVVADELLPALIVTVDNGIASIEGVARAAELGIDVVVTDHHLPGEQLPAAAAIVNPNAPGCAFASKHLAGVGVIFYVMLGLRAELRARGWFGDRSEPNLARYLDLVALGTVADVVALDGNNRVLVQQGLQRMRAGLARPGIRALLEAGGRDPRRVVSADLGFVVAPRINAAGRLDDMSLGIRCLVEDDLQCAREMAAQLDALNRERREIEAGMRDDAERAVAALADSAESLPWGVCLMREDWHQGVVGLVASRIKERHHRPTIAFAPGGEGELKGSGRSIPGFHLRDALANIAARHPGLLQRFGGHAMAAGMTLASASFAEFAAAFDAEVRRSLGIEALASVLETDGPLAATEMTLAQAELLRAAAPWGQQFPEPLFDGEFEVRSQRLVGERHLKLQLACGGQPQRVFDAIAFHVDTACWPAPGVSRVHLAYRLDVNEYRGERRLQLLVEDLRPLLADGHAA